MLSRIVCVLGATVALGIATVSAQSASPVSAASVEPPSTSLLALQSKAVKSGGTLRVIVLLQENSGSPVDAGATSDAAVAAANYAAQSSVAARTLGGSSRIVSRVNNVPIFVANVTPAEMARLAADPMVASVAEDALLQPSLRDSLPIIGMTGAGGAYAKGAAGKGRAVAILDTGVNKNNEFLKGKVISEACFNSKIPSAGASSRCPGGATSSIKAGSGADCTASFASGCGHGTHVAGISAGKNPTVIASQPVNGVAFAAGIVGINVFSKISAQACQASKPCVSAFTSDIIKGLDRVYDLRKGVANRKIDSVNMSLGGSAGYTGFCDARPEAKATAAMVNKLVKAGIAVVIASGNGSFVNGVSFPACIKNATTVGSTTKKSAGNPEKLAFYSNSGPQVDVLATGGELGYAFSGDRGGIQSSEFNGYAFLQGTSMAAPHVAGVFAAIRSAKGCTTKSVAAIEAALKSTGTTIQDKRGPCSFCLQLKKPRVNVSKALDKLGCGT